MSIRKDPDKPNSRGYAPDVHKFHHDAPTNNLPPGYCWASDLLEVQVLSYQKQRHEGFYTADPNWKWLLGPNGQGLDYANPSHRMIYDRMMPEAFANEQRKREQSAREQSNISNTRYPIVETGTYSWQTSMSEQVDTTAVRSDPNTSFSCKERTWVTHQSQ